jgi:GNAT superfamily N-acetyltransferase
MPRHGVGGVGSPLTVEVLSIEELPKELLPQLVLLSWTDHDASADLATLRKARAMGYPFAEYFGVAAVDDGTVLGQILVERHRLTTDHGVEEFAGISSVVTRPDALGRGLCTRLFEEVHRRETARGIRLAMLWTRRSWTAHRLYEHLGYRDAFTQAVAVRRAARHPRPRLRPGYRSRPAKASDAPVLESLLAHATRGRVGFVQLFPHSFRTRFTLGWRVPREHRLLLHRSRPVGYFLGVGNRTIYSVVEGAVRSPEHLPALFDAMDTAAGHRWLTLGHTTLANDAAPLLRERGFAIAPSSHATLMARGLNGSPRTLDTSLRRTFRDPRFTCHRGNMF